jgi:hypothetical protein
MTKEERLTRFLRELELHESIVCLPCTLRIPAILRDAVTYLLNGEHRTPVCRDCCQRELGYGNAPDGLWPVEQPYITRRIREELPRIAAGL